MPILSKKKYEKSIKANENRKHDQKINRTNALAMTKDILISLFIRKDLKKAFEAFDDVVCKTREIIKPSRSFKRNHRPKKPYSMNYKRL